MSQLYALVSPTDQVDRYASNIDPATGTKPGWRWLPVVDDLPPYDSATQVASDIVIAVLIDMVTRTRTVRDKTLAELEADANTRRDVIAAAMDELEDITRAAVLVIKDEFNLHSTKLDQILAAAAGASSLASFKTAMAAIQPIPQRTGAQLKTAIRAKLGVNGSA